MTIKEMQERKKELGFTYAQIAELSGVPVGTVQKVLGGITLTPRYETIMALEQVLGESEGLMLRESVNAYMTKKQGEYTLDDYYHVIPDDMRVELIDGVIYDMAAPSMIHQYIIMRLCSELYGYVEKNGGDCVVLPSPLDVQIDCDDRSMLEPDLVVVCDPSKRTRRCIMGAPDLVVEILSPSSTRMDTKIKLGKYATAGVREYWLIDPDRERVCVYWSPEDDIATVYGPQDDVPVGIFGGEFSVPMSRIFEQIRQMWPEEE